MFIMRTIIMVVLAFLAAFYIPTTSGVAPSDLIPTLLIFAFLLGFLVNRAMDRKQMLLASFAIELSRLRRLNHLAEFLGDDQWKTNLRVAVENYQLEVSKNILKYSDSHELFRKLTHHIYSYKIAKTEQESVLFAECLATLRDITLERQKLEQLINGGLPKHSWFFMFSITSFVVLILFLARQDLWPSKIVYACAIASTILAIDFLRVINTISKSLTARIQDMYKQNFAHSNNL